MAAILNFRIFRKIAKHKNAYISKTVLDRAISTKFLTHRVSLQSSQANFQKKFVLPKMAAILNFRIFTQKLQNTKMLIFRKPCYIERFRRNFLSSGYLCREACPDDNLKGILSIHLKLGKYIYSIKIWKSLDFGIDWSRNGRVIND